MASSIRRAIATPACIFPIASGVQLVQYLAKDRHPTHTQTEKDRLSYNIGVSIDGSVNILLLKSL
jgi:hypothetical protein